MDHDRLKKLRGAYWIVLALLVGACGAKNQTAEGRLPQVAGIPPTVLESPLSPLKLYESSEKFLEYQLGYELRVRDLERGLLVSDWSRESALDRHQITLRIQPNVKGSLVSAHIRAEEFSEGGWRDVPTTGAREQIFLTQLDTYLKSQSPSSTR